MRVAHRLHPLIGFVAQPTKHSLLDFEVKTKKTIAVILWTKSPNRNYQFWGTNRKTQASGFDVKSQEP
jgi:hypothetical protein